MNKLKDKNAIKPWKVAEECGEVIQAISKIYRFGLNTKRKGNKNTNKVNLLNEINDLKLAIEELEEILK